MDDQKVSEKLQDFEKRNPTRGLETLDGKIHSEGLFCNRKRFL